MNARLFCKTGPLAGSEYRIGEDATIGRQKQNDITLPHDAVSERHARIFFDEEANCYVLEDLNTSTGTRVDDTEVLDPVPLKDLHIITFAEKVDCIFQAVAEEAAPSSEGAEKTQFGAAPESPSSLLGEDEPEGEKTRVGGAPEELPELPDVDSTSEDEDRTRFGESPPELPDLSEDDESDEPDGERTQMGEAPGALPDLSEEETAPEKDEGDAVDEDQTQFGEAPPELPNLSDEDVSEEEPDGDRTQMGEAPGALPDLPDEESSVEDEEAEDDDRTRFGESPPDLPDLSEEPSGDDSDDEEVPSPGEPSPRYTLRVTVEGGPADTHPLPDGEVTIGRSPDCDIQIEDPGVSREHARLIVDAGEVVLEDVGSKNFTFVDGERLSEPTTLSPDSELQFGLQAKAVLHRASS